MKQNERRSTNNIGIIHIAATSDNIGAALHPALKNKAGCTLRAYRCRRRIRSTKKEFSRIFFIHSASPNS